MCALKYFELKKRPVLDPCFKTYTTYNAILDVCTYSIGRKRRKGGALALFHAQGAISGCPHRAQAKQPYGSPKFMYFDGSVTWRLNISASLGTQTNVYARCKPSRMSNGEKDSLGGSRSQNPNPMLIILVLKRTSGS